MFPSQAQNGACTFDPIYKDSNGFLFLKMTPVAHYPMPVVIDSR
jgi:hypothetical protein